MNIKPKIYFWISVGLACGGLSASIYLANLFIDVHTGKNVDSFCAINEQFNCVDVANCDYSTVFDIPIAVYGVEFYLVVLGALFLSSLFKYPIKRWESLVFFLSTLSIPVSIALGLVSVFLIKSFCIVCGSVYLVNTLLFINSGFAGKWKLKELFFEWFFDLRQAVKSSFLFEVVFAGLVLLSISQFFFLPSQFNFSLGEFKGEHQASSSNPFLLGNPNAPIQVKEFTDFQCPFCAIANHEILQVYNKFPQLIAIKHIDYPLGHDCNPYIRKPFHLMACSAAKYARCAAKQGKFWEYEKLLFMNQDSLDKSLMLDLGKSIGLNVEEMESCAKGSDVLASIHSDIEEGASLRLKGTPAFIVNGELVEGMRNAEFWEQKIKEIMSIPMTNQPQ